MRFYLLLFFLFLLASCDRSHFEMEEIANDVLKQKEGVEIDVKPLPVEQIRK